MIQKDKIYIISSNIDDSIKNESLYTDITIFKTFSEFELYVDVTPVDAENIIINSRDLKFTSTNIDRIMKIVNSSFVTITGKVYYLVDEKDIFDKFNIIINKNDYNILKPILLDSLSNRDIANVVNGTALLSKDTITEVKTYRIRASDYVKSENDKLGMNLEDIYVTDEDELSGIPDEEIPEDLRVSDTLSVTRFTVCGSNIRERTSWVILKAQYLSLKGKTLLLERDSDYHTLIDMIYRLDVDYEYFDITDIFRDCYSIINKMRESKSKLLVVGSKNRIDYNYDVLLNILVANLENTIQYYIYETDISQIPYGVPVDVVTPTTVPEILKCINKMPSITVFDNILFVGLNITNFGLLCVNSSEYKNILIELFQDSTIHAVTFKINGLLLREEAVPSGVFMHDLSAY